MQQIKTLDLRLSAHFTQANEILISVIIVLSAKLTRLTKPLSFRVFDLFTRNAVSDKLNSRAINCSHSSSLSFGKINTAAGLPLYPRFVNASICQFINNLHQDLQIEYW
jgi:hypothetical protein